MGKQNNSRVAFVVVVQGNGDRCTHYCFIGENCDGSPVFLRDSVLVFCPPDYSALQSVQGRQSKLVKDTEKQARILGIGFFKHGVCALLEGIAQIVQVSQNRN